MVLYLLNISKKNTLGQVIEVCFSTKNARFLSGHFDCILGLPITEHICNATLNKGKNYGNL